jgi:ParB family chromosome partitioning protein
MSKDASRPRALGRGLSGLISNSAASSQADTDTQVSGDAGAWVSASAGPAGQTEIGVDQIAPNPYQPRRDFDEQGLAELAESIRQQGILQPLIVAQQAGDAEGVTSFVVIAGERRLRAARLAGLAKVPCIVRRATPQQMLEWALVENIQRSDLNPIDRARAYREYMDRFALNQAAAAERLAQPRATVANYLRLLELDVAIQDLLRTGELSFGHAKVLASLAGEPQRQLVLARKAIAANLSVHQLQRLIDAGAGRSVLVRKQQRTREAYLDDLEARLSEIVGTKVVILPGRGRNRGRIVIQYNSLQDFDQIAAKLGLDEEAMGLGPIT